MDKRMNKKKRADMEEEKIRDGIVSNGLYLKHICINYLRECRINLRHSQSCKRVVDTSTDLVGGERG